MTGKKNIRVAVIDMNNQFPNQGLRGILGVLSSFELQHGLQMEVAVFDLRAKHELPGTDFDIYISSGGPGSPFDGEGEEWERVFFRLLDELDDYNRINPVQKFVFLICHSFQMACRKYNVGLVTKRKSNSFGIFPVTLTPEGESDLLYAGLENPFYAVDSRDWQVIDTSGQSDSNLVAEILALEKERPHIDLERCVMSVRFSAHMVGTQFHPEADPVRMKAYLLEDEKKQAIIAAHGEEKYQDMMASLDNPAHIHMTQTHILPNFLTAAITGLDKMNYDQQIQGSI